MHWLKLSTTLYRNFLIFFFAICLTCSYIPPTQANSLRTAANLSEDELIDMALLVSSVAAFKETARTDYAKALLAFSKDRGMEQLHQIDLKVWDKSQAQFGWEAFFNSAVVAYADINKKSPAVGLYNPYSDTFLITVWSKGDNTYQITDAEMLMGDWIRSDNQELDIIPLWLRGNQHRPLTLGISVAQTLLSFEKVFSESTVHNWRTKLPILNEKELLEKINTPGITVLMNAHLLNLLDFSNPDKNGELLKTCGERAFNAIKLAADNKSDVLLSVADGTLPQTAQSIKTYPGEWFSSLKVSNVRTGPEGCLVFFSSPQQTNRNLTLFLQGAKSIYLRPKRIDLIDYQFFYDELKQDPTKGGLL